MHMYPPPRAVGRQSVSLSVVEHGRLEDARGGFRGSCLLVWSLQVFVWLFFAACRYLRSSLIFYFFTTLFCPCQRQQLAAVLLLQNKTAVMKNISFLKPQRQALLLFLRLRRGVRRERKTPTASYIHRYTAVPAFTSDVNTAVVLVLPTQDQTATFRTRHTLFRSLFRRSKCWCGRKCPIRTP